MNKETFNRATTIKNQITAISQLSSLLKAIQTSDDKCEFSDFQIVELLDLEQDRKVSEANVSDLPSELIKNILEQTEMCKNKLESEFDSL